MQNRKFEGVWISKEIWLSKELTLQEKVFFVEIRSLDNEKGCFAGNDYFSDFFDVSNTRASEVINSLIKKGYIENVSFDGRQRTLKVCKAAFKESLKQPSRNLEGRVKENFNPTINNTNNNTSNKKDGSYEPPPPPTYKTKKKIFEKRGLPYKHKTLTEKQKRFEAADKIITEFRNKADENGFDLLNAENKQRNSRIRGQIEVMLIQKRDFTGFIDWWFEGKGEWCGFAPENLFQDKTFEEFKNKKTNSEQNNCFGQAL